MAQISNRSAQLFFALLIILGLAAIAFGITLAIKGMRTEHWPITNGKIESANLKEQSSRNGPTYSAEVTYRYQVNGDSYTGNKISVGALSSSDEYARAILNRYPVGAPVSVHYSPGDPADAVLETGIHGGTWLCFGVGTVFTLAGVMFLRLFKSPVPELSWSLEPQDGSGRNTKPPVLMGILFMLMGSFAFFGRPAREMSEWIGPLAGGIFVLIGITLILSRLKNKIYAKIAGVLAGLLFLALFHWISFGPGERIGTSTMLFFTKTGHVKTPFAICTILADVLILAGIVRFFRQRNK